MLRNKINLIDSGFFLLLVINPFQIRIKSYYILGDEKVNNYDDYYGYMNYMTGNIDMPNDIGMRNVDMNYQSIIDGKGLSNYIDMGNLGMNYQTKDNNLFSSNFMMPTANNELLKPEEGLEKGNLFKNLYVPYKKYKPVKLESKSERERMLNEIRSYGFAMKDLNLYLDVNPNNTNYINLYNEYRKKKEDLVNQYERMYGPLDLTSSALENNNWVWNNSPWPWEGDK